MPDRDREKQEEELKKQIEREYEIREQVRFIGPEPMQDDVMVQGR